MGGSLGVTLEVDSDVEEGSTQLGKLCCHLGQGEDLGALVAEAGGVCGMGSSWKGEGYPLGNA